MTNVACKIDNYNELEKEEIDYFIKNKTKINVFLINGIKLEGIITGHDSICLNIKRFHKDQLIYKSNISTIEENEGKGKNPWDPRDK